MQAGACGSVQAQSQQCPDGAIVTIGGGSRRAQFNQPISSGDPRRTPDPWRSGKRRIPFSYWRRSVTIEPVSHVRRHSPCIATRWSRRPSLGPVPWCRRCEAALPGHNHRFDVVSGMCGCPLEFFSLALEPAIPGDSALAACRRDARMAVNADVEQDVLVAI